MARPTRETRKSEIAAAALQAFTEKGYRLTQVADVAKLAGVAAGTIYLFAKSKEDLFWMALKLSVGKPLDEIHPSVISAEELRAEMISHSQELRLRTVLDSGDVLPSLEQVLLDHWNVVSGSAQAIKLVERCAQDWPELAAAFYGDLRKNVIRDLAEYLTVGGEQGLCRKLPKPEGAARLIIETIAWFAMHRLGDPDGRNIPAEDARDVTLDALLHAYGLGENS